MLKVLRGWLHRYFSDEQAVVLAVLLILGFATIFFLGKILAPVLISLVLAFLMQGLISSLEKRLHFPHNVAFGLVFAFFLGMLAVFLLVLMPLIGQQVSHLFNELPRMLGKWQSLFLMLPKNYPEFITDQQVFNIIKLIQGEAGQIGQLLLSVSISSLPVVASAVIYIVLVPILIFFFLKDRLIIGRWFVRCLPQERSLITQVAVEMNQQIANYIRGKAIEILVCGGATYIVFAIIGLNYAALLALAVGLSVIIPYVGAVAVTIPVALIGMVQWGLGDQFLYLMIAYLVVQALDSNVLVPLLFSEAVDLHPVAIICAVLLFGGLWGFWGVFFAIPLATLCKALLDAWPRVERINIKE
ncbi:UNVERIFIED_CONTAM: hypothetical protein GTU68_008990 [Idotea baltica]|nr:hypothetical protein [Idotea baltica]